MTRHIFKYPMPDPGDTHSVDLPAGFKIIHIAKQGATIFAWAEVDRYAPVTSHPFITLPTGVSVPSNVTHVGTVMDGAFVWHVYGALE